MELQHRLQSSPTGNKSGSKGKWGTISYPQSCAPGILRHFSLKKFHACLLWILPTIERKGDKKILHPHLYFEIFSLNLKLALHSYFRKTRYLHFGSFLTFKYLFASLVYFDKELVCAKYIFSLVLKAHEVFNRSSLFCP